MCQTWTLRSLGWCLLVFLLCLLIKDPLGNEWVDSTPHFVEAKISQQIHLKHRFFFYFSQRTFGFFRLNQTVWWFSAHNKSTLQRHHHQGGHFLWGQVPVGLVSVELGTGNGAHLALQLAKYFLWTALLSRNWTWVQSLTLHPCRHATLVKIMQSWSFISAFLREWPLWAFCRGFREIRAVGGSQESITTHFYFASLEAEERVRKIYPRI